MADTQNLTAGIREARLAVSEELPIRALRRRLTLSFVWVSILIYVITSVMAMIVVSSSLNVSIDNNLKRLIAEVLPSVKIEEGELTLREWAANADRQNLHIFNVVQLYDRSGKLREEYGTAGIRQLLNGPYSRDGFRFLHDFRSRYVPVQDAGYLQIQVDTKQTGEALFHFLITMLVLVPVVALTAGAVGYLFCGKAVAPVSESFKMLRRFIDDAGHELRTPVAIISASIETLEQALSEDPTQMDVIKKVSRAGLRLKRLSSELLELARMESPNFELAPAELDAGNLIGQVCDDYSTAAKDKGIELICQANGAAPLAGNAVALQQLLSNLLENAINYTPAGGTVKMSCHTQNAQVVIVVEDTGAGIPPECLKYVFDRFYRVDPARTREQGGTGLGLSIAKAIAEAHGGSISVTSALHKGSKFTVVLPGKAPV